VVGIAATISVSALVFFKATDESNKVSMEAKNVATLASGIANIFSGQGHYTGLNNAVVLSSNVLPSSMRGPGATDMKHSWKSNGINLSSEQLVSGSYDDVFVITYDSVPDKSCVDLISKTYIPFLSVLVNGSLISSVADIPPACNLGNANVLVWKR
jgi:hypothetical protein